MQHAVRERLDSASEAKFVDAGADAIETRGEILARLGYRTLNEGQAVEFKLVEGPKGLQAEDVLKL